MDAVRQADELRDRVLAVADAIEQLLGDGALGDVLIGVRDRAVIALHIDQLAQARIVVGVKVHRHADVDLISQQGAYALEQIVLARAELIDFRAAVQVQKHRIDIPVFREYIEDAPGKEVVSILGHDAIGQRDRIDQRHQLRAGFFKHARRIQAIQHFLALAIDQVFLLKQKRIERICLMVEHTHCNFHFNSSVVHET